MENFKEIAEKCLAGELSGIFKNRKGENIPSGALCRYSSKTYPYGYYYSKWVCVTVHGDFFKSGKFSEYDIIDFIPDNMQQQIKIDIPEGMEIRDIARKEHDVTITLQEKKLTYGDIISSLLKSNSDVVYEFWSDKISEGASKPFYKKVEIIRKLTNIRNYFGKPVGHIGYTIIQSGVVQISTCYSNLPIFAKKEHAEQAIKILGDELKYLFEPW